MTRMDEVKDRMLGEFEAGHTPDIAKYVAEHPEHREELLDFWVLAMATSPHSRSDEPGRPPQPLDPKERAFVRDLCLAASLGPGWLELSAHEGAREMAAIGAEMRRLRAVPYQFRGRAAVSFRRIAVYGWIGSVTAQGARPVSRLRLQKLAYFLEHGLELGLFRQHSRHRFGPYDPSLTYRDAEPGCIKAGYLVRVDDSLVVGPNIATAVRYAVRYLRDERVAEGLLQSLRGLDEWDLEVLATVHAVVTDRVRTRTDVTVEVVQEALERDDTWRQKLSRSNFTGEKIAEALQTLTLLTLV